MFTLLSTQYRNKSTDHTQYTVHSTQYTVHSTQYTVQKQKYRPHSVHSTHYSVHSTETKVQTTLSTLNKPWEWLIMMQLLLIVRFHLQAQSLGVLIVVCKACLCNWASVRMGVCVCVSVCLFVCVKCCSSKSKKNVSCPLRILFCWSFSIKLILLKLPLEN